MKGTARANTKNYQTAQECRDDAIKAIESDLTASSSLNESSYTCVGRTKITGKRSTPPVIPPTTPGLGHLPANPRINVGFSTDRTQPTTEVARRAGDGTGDFRTRCSPSHFAFDDPIVFPGQSGRSHLHVFFGNTGANANSTASSLMTTGNSTCVGGTINRSSYWVPAMIDTRTGLPIVPDDSDFYYKSGYRGVQPAQVNPMPAGLRMIAGDPRNTADLGWESPYTFVCHGSDQEHTRGRVIPDCPVGMQVELSIAFPQCVALDPVTRSPLLDSPDHKSHMAYGVPGGCPPSHPHALPEVSFHVLFPVRVVGETRYWRLSSDTYTGPAGYSAHADWFNGWRKDISDIWGTLCVHAGNDCGSHLLGNGLSVY